MEKVQLSNLALKHLVDENQLIVNGFINKIQTLENSWMKFKVHTKEGDKTLVVTPNSFFISNKSLNAKQNPGGFSAFLKKHLFNQRIITFEQHGVDRIVILEFPEKYLILELFAKGNVILCDKEFKILRAMRKEQWKDRTLASEEEYKFPSSKGKNPTEISQKEFLDQLAQSKKSFFGACVELLNVAPAIMENVFEELKIEKKIDASKSGANGKKVLEQIKKIYSSKKQSVYLSGNIIYTTKSTSALDKEFESLNEALNELLIEEIKPFATEQEVRTVKKKDRKDEYLAQIKEAQKKEIEYKKIGEKIYLEYGTISEIISAVNKGKDKGLGAEEIMNKINSVNPIVKKIDLAKNKVIVEL